MIVGPGDRDDALSRLACEPPGDAPLPLSSAPDAVPTRHISRRTLYRGWAIFMGMIIAILFLFAPSD